MSHSAQRSVAGVCARSPVSHPPRSSCSRWVWRGLWRRPNSVGSGGQSGASGPPTSAGSGRVSGCRTRCTDSDCSSTRRVNSRTSETRTRSTDSDCSSTRRVHSWTSETRTRRPAGRRYRSPGAERRELIPRRCGPSRPAAPAGETLDS